MFMPSNQQLYLLLNVPGTLLSLVSKPVGIRANAPGKHWTHRAQWCGDRREPAHGHGLGGEDGLADHCVERALDEIDTRQAKASADLGLCLRLNPNAIIYLEIASWMLNRRPMNQEFLCVIT